MEKYFSLLEGSPLFAGITEEELHALLPALGGRTASYGKGEQLLRAGESVTALGVILEGQALVIQEDFWGNCSLLAALPLTGCACRLCRL